MTKKRWTTGWRIVTASAALMLFTQAPLASAEDLSELKNEKQQIEKKKNDLDATIQNKSDQLQANVEKQQAAVEKIQALTVQIAETNDKLFKLNQEITDTNQEIEELAASIAELERKIEERNELLAERARAVQARGQVSYIDVLLSSSSFVDFIDRFTAVNTLIDADRKIIEEQEADRARLEVEKAEIEKRKRELEIKKAEVERLKATLAEQKAEQDRQIAALEEAEAKLKKEKQLLEVEHEDAVSLSEELQNKIVAEQQRMAEIARQQAAKAAAAQQQQQRQAAPSGGVSDSAASVPLPSTSAGTWTRPSSGPITSNHGWRNIGEGDEYHYGLDIGSAYGSAVVAAADGVVSHAAPLSTYGNLIMVTHSIDGQIYTTVYAHLSDFNVSQGQTVTKGQQIGSVGSTGRSTGPHLHFELHTGAWQGQRVNNINPMYYIPF